MFFKILAKCLVLFPLILKAEASYQVLTLGSPIIDHIFMIDEEQLRTITEEKGSWAPIDYKKFCSLLHRNAAHSKMVLGGSGINVIKGLTHLGHKCAVIGKIGCDELGDYYLSIIKKLGIQSFLEKGALPTGQALCFITPDGYRTFRTYLGASHSLSDLKIVPSLFEGLQLFHVEGYQLTDQDLVIHTLKMAKEANVKISMNIGNFEVARRYKSFILDILKKYVDIFICNENDAKELTELPPSEACNALAAFCDIAGVNMGERGSWIQSGKEKIFQPSFPVKIIDTTGRGDLFISGFLHGYLQKKSLRECAWRGALLASYVVKVIGSDISNHIWDEIIERIATEFNEKNK